MYWIVFLALISITDLDPVTVLEVPVFAQGKEFSTLNECQSALTAAFVNGDFPELQNKERKWQLIQDGKLIEGRSHSQEVNKVFTYQIMCVKNPNQKGSETWR